MKEGVCVINSSRGSVVDIEALVYGLEQGIIKGAAVDVFPTEPSQNSIPFETPLQRFNNVILTPHIGGSTQEAQKNIGTRVAHKLVDFIEEGTSMGAVNFPNLSLRQRENAHRLIHVHKNIAGMLKQINRVIADEDINVLGQHLETSKDIGYVALDFEKPVSQHLIDKLNHIEGTVFTRVVY